MSGLEEQLGSWVSATKDTYILALGEGFLGEVPRRLLTTQLGEQGLRTQLRKDLKPKNRFQEVLFQYL